MGSRISTPPSQMVCRTLKPRSIACVPGWSRSWKTFQLPHQDAHGAQTRRCCGDDRRRQRRGCRVVVNGPDSPTARVSISMRVPMPCCWAKAKRHCWRSRKPGDKPHHRARRHSRTRAWRDQWPNAQNRDHRLSATSTGCPCGMGSCGRAGSSACLASAARPLSWNMAASRGCPYACNWCAKPTFGGAMNSAAPNPWRGRCVF